MYKIVIVKKKFLFLHLFFGTTTYLVITERYALLAQMKPEKFLKCQARKYGGSRVKRGLFISFVRQGFSQDLIWKSGIYSATLPFFINISFGTEEL